MNAFSLTTVSFDCSLRIGDSCGGGNDSVHEYSIDGLMQADTGRIALMKVGASEFAVDVLKGALMTLAGGAIDVVMVELQVNMFQSREAVWELLWILVVQHKLQCSYLGFVDSDGVAIAVKTFHEVPLKESSLSSFVKFVFGVTLEGGQEAVKTEIFCAKARRAMWWM